MAPYELCCLQGIQAAVPAAPTALEIVGKDEERGHRTKMETLTQSSMSLGCEEMLDPAGAQSAPYVSDCILKCTHSQ